MAISPENRTRFEAIGVELVRIDLLRAFEGGMIARGTDRRQADEWITEQDRKRRRYGCWRDAALLLHRRYRCRDSRMAGDQRRRLREVPDELSEFSALNFSTIRCSNARYSAHASVA